MQISPINSSSIHNRKNNPNFRGHLSFPLAGKLADFVDSNSNVNVAVRMLADVVEFDTKPELQVLLRELPEEAENVGFNSKIMYIDPSTQALGAKEFFIDKAKSAQEIYMALRKALSEEVPNSFISQ